MSEKKRAIKSVKNKRVCLIKNGKPRLIKSEGSPFIEVNRKIMEKIQGKILSEIVYVIK